MFSSEFETLSIHLEWNDTKYCYLKGSVSSFHFVHSVFISPLSPWLCLSTSGRGRRKNFKGRYNNKWAEYLITLYNKNGRKTFEPVLIISPYSFMSDIYILWTTEVFTPKFLLSEFKIKFKDRILTMPTISTQSTAKVKLLNIRRAIKILKVKQIQHPVWDLSLEQSYLFIPLF